MHQHHTILAAVLSVALANISLTESAAAQELTPRVMLVPSENCSALTALESEESNVLVAREPIETFSFEFAPSYVINCDAAAETLAGNFPGLPPEGVIALADLLCGEMANANFVGQSAMHVGKGGQESLSIHFEQWAPQGAVALTGTDGDVLVLGEFQIYLIHSGNDSDCTTFGYCNTWAFTTDPGQADETVCLAIGWFTR